MPQAPLESRLTRLSCALWGHHVDNHVFERAWTRGRRCRCGVDYLPEDGATTHVRHTLSCFLGHHTYKRLTGRHGYHEYVCVQCGHPLLFRADADPYAAEQRFAKKVRYLCGLFGHRVVLAARRDGFLEYACHCGHTFLKLEGEDRGQATIRHPLSCALRGHWIRFVTRRGGFAEYMCPTCGHPFCFADAQSVNSAPSADGLERRRSLAAQDVDGVDAERAAHWQIAGGDGRSQ